MKPASFYFLKKDIDQLSLDPATKSGLRLCFILIGLQFIILAVFWHRLPPQLPLFYSRAYGENRLAPQWALWLVPATVLVFQLISIRVAVKIGAQDRLWTQILSWLGTIMALMGLVTLIKIIISMV